MTEREHLFVGGRWVTPSTNQRIDVITPHTEELLGRAAAASTDDVDDAVAAARKAFDSGPW
nr:aldehyde dehydrogenase family protein [Micromonospora sp. DSM 115978]